MKKLANDESTEGSSNVTEQQKIIYEQNCQSFRQLNNVMWQVPVLAMTLTGGIWFGISTVRDDPRIEIALWVLATVANAGFIIVLWRLRAGVMERLLTKMRTYEGTSAGRGHFTVIVTFSIMLGYAAGISVYGAYATYTTKPIQTAVASRLVVESADDGIRVFCE